MARKPVVAFLMLLLLSAPSGAAAETAKLGERVKTMRLQYRSAKGAAARKTAGTSLIAALVALADTKATGEHAAEAVKLYREAIPIATILRSGRADIAAKLKSAQARALLEKKLMVLRAALADAPGDAKAQTKLILFHLHELDDPAGARKYLTEDIDEAIRTYIPMAAKPVEEIDPAVCQELGQWYYQQTSKASAAGKRVVLTRAMKYYRRYLAETKDTGIKKLRGKLVLHKIEKELGKFRTSVTIHWNMADDADVYLNGKPLREYKPDFRSRRDEARQIFSAKAQLGVGDVFTVGGRRGGSYGFLLVAIDKKGKTLWQSDTKNWNAYVPVDTKNWYMPAVAARSPKTKITVNPRPWRVQAKMRSDMRIEAQSIWPGPGTRSTYLVSVVR